MSIDTTFTKTCTKCKEVKGAEGFPRHKGKKDGLASACKSWEKAYKTSPEVKAAQIKAIAKIDFTTYTKACNKCGEVKGAEGFYRNKKAKDGLLSACKSCVSSRQTSPEVKAARLEAAAKAIAKIDFTTYTKACKKCGEVKGAEGFNKNNLAKDGLQSSCKSCDKTRKAAHYEANKAEILAKLAEYRSRPEVKAEILAKQAAYYEATKAERQAQGAAYRKANPEKTRARCAKRRAAKIERTPNWLSKYELDYMTSIYAIAGQAQKIEGEEKHVDHLVPLRGEDVSGLHVPWNLVLVPAIDNMKKGNKFCIDTYNARWHNT